MTSNIFFEKFEQFAETPNAVAKMRELVLQLATCGKLVMQLPDDEPTSMLLTRIHQHFDLRQNRKEPFGLNLEPLKHDNLPEIPASWEWVRLGNVVDYGSSDKVESTNIPEDAWLLDLEDIEKDTSRLLQRKTFGQSPSKSTKTAFLVGDVLYGKLRPYLNKVIVADAPGYCTTEIIPIRTFGFIEPAYLCYALKRPAFISYAISKSYGMNLPRLGTEDAQQAPFPLPPLAEQKRIVTKVDELMVLCDRLEKQQKERETQHTTLARASLSRFAEAPTPQNLDLLFHPSFIITPDDLRKSILTLAIQGKLVPQDPNGEPTTPYLENEAPFNIPPGWKWKPLGILGTCKTGKTPPTGDPVNYGAGFPFIGPGQITFGGIITPPEKTLTQTGLANSTEACAGDILMVCIGGSIGKAAICSETVGFNQQINSIRLERDLPTFVYGVFKSAYFQEQMLARASGSATPIINKGKWEQILIPLPPLAEQHRIIAKVDQLMSLVDELETQLVTSHETGKKLMEAIVSELTSGVNYA